MSPAHPKIASTEHPVLDVIRRRWSPRAFSDRRVERAKLRQLFEAARWAPSSRNEQPWRFLVATRDEPADYARLLECLNEKNQTWARTAPVLGITLARLRFSRNDKVNQHARHDLGQAVMSLSLQAAGLDLFVHQMAGILPDKARVLLHVPDDFEVVTGLAIGYLGDPARVPEERRAGERSPRSRAPLEEIVFGADFGMAATWLAGGSGPD